MPLLVKSWEVNNMDKMIFQKDWYEGIVNNEYVETTEQEMAYILYAAMRYCFYDETTDLGEVFGKEFKGLNRDMSNIYTQIDKIKNWSEDLGKKNQKYDDPRIEELAAEGLTQKEICLELGYDPSKSKSLSSVAYYTKGRARYLEKKKLEKDSSSKSVESVTKNASSFNF
jgi:hypothetical protein